MASLEGISFGEIYMGAALFYLPVAYVVATVLGIPMFFLFRAVGLKHVFAYRLGGAAMGLAAAFLTRVLFLNSSVGLSYFVL